MSTLKVEEKIVLAASVERVWRFLLDPHAVAPCLPGARLDAVEDERTFTGTMKVKVGPVTTEFKGRARFTEIVEAERRVEMTASGDDKGGSGSAKMVMQSRVVATEGGGSELVVVADVDLAGKRVLTDFDIFAVGFCRSMMRAPTLGMAASGTTNALTASPECGCGTPTTPTSATPGCSASTSSTSAGNTLKPLTMIRSLARSTR